MRGRGPWVVVPLGVLAFAAWFAVSRAAALPEAAVTTPPRLWGGLAGTEASAIGRTAAVALLVAAGCSAVAAWGDRQAPRSRGHAAVALVGGTFAAVAWYEAALFGTLVLRDVAQAEPAVGLAQVRPAVHVIASLALVAAAPALLRGRSVPAALLTAGITVVVGCAAWGARAALALGPDPALGAFAHVVPVHHPAQAQRVPWGCVLHREDTGEWRGLPLVRKLPRFAPGCPDPLVHGAFDPKDAPLFAVPADTPSTELADWTPGTHGDVRIVVRLVEDPPHHLEAWWLSEVRIGVREPPVEGDPSTRPLPGAVLLHAGETWDGEGPLRMELLVLPEAAPTVGDLLAVCDAATRRHPRGLVCTLAVGDGWAAWADDQAP